MSDVRETLAVDGHTVAFEESARGRLRVWNRLFDCVGDHVVRSRQRSSVEPEIATTAGGAGKNSRAAERHEPAQVVLVRRNAMSDAARAYAGCRRRRRRGRRPTRATAPPTRCATDHRAKACSCDCIAVRCATTAAGVGCFESQRPSAAHPLARDPVGAVHRPRSGCERDLDGARRLVGRGVERAARRRRVGTGVSRGRRVRRASDR